NRTAYIYALALRKDVKHPFPPESDEVTVAKPDEAPKPKGTPPGEEPKSPVKDIDKELKKEPAEAASPTPSPSPSGQAAPTESKPDAAPKPPASLTIDFDGLAARVARVPV